MNLLPEKDELLPITNSKSTFYDCGFNSDFEQLLFEKKLQVLCDIVRQTIYPNVAPNPDNDVINLDGNCYTASKVLKKYLEELNVGNNIRQVLCRQRKFDPEDISSLHSILLVDSDDNETYQVDPSPFAGYKYGSVVNIKHNKIYNDCQIVNEEVEYYLYELRKIVYLDSINMIDKNNIKHYLKIFNTCAKYRILDDYVAKTMNIIIKYLDSVYDMQKMKEKILKLKPYSKSNAEKLQYQRSLLNAQLDKWLEELNDLKLGDLSYRRQLELAINITQEIKRYDSSFERFVNIDGESKRLSFVNPRYLYEKNLNTVMIKPSAYFIEKEKTIKSSFVENFGNFYAEYYIDLSKATELLNIKPMLFSHPCGEEYVRPMTGLSNIMLFKGYSFEINDLKRMCRNSLCKEMWYKTIKWSDGEDILWHPFYTNLVHASDNFSEASLHFLIGYPEHQTMTRFMYPNPRLIKERL